MDNEPPYVSAGQALKSWRRASARSQLSVGEAFVPKVSQAAVSKWEDGAQRPELARAMQLEGLTGGAVPAVLWLYTVAEINALRAAFGFPSVDPNAVADEAA